MAGTMKSFELITVLTTVLMYFSFTRKGPLVSERHIDNYLSVKTPFHSRSLTTLLLGHSDSTLSI